MSGVPVPPPFLLDGISWIGSLQDQRANFVSENPLEEAWAFIARYATNEYLAKHPANCAALPWADYLNFVKVRIKQALEFRLAASSASLLTAPLPLYYSFLSLMRAFIALGPEIMPKPAHGLKFDKQTDILKCGARIQPGTFTDYLDAAKIPWKAGDCITLGDTLGCIPEIEIDIRTFNLTPQYAQLVLVDAKRHGRVSLWFPGYPKDFSANWMAEFPQLVPICKLSNRPLVLEVNDGALGVDYDKVSDFLNKYLCNSLTVVERAEWWAIRQGASVKLDRLASYHVATFILGSAVRYQPELVLAVSSSDSGVGLMLTRFLKAAERFYPQLASSFILGGRQIYFGSSG